MSVEPTPLFPYVPQFTSVNLTQFGIHVQMGDVLAMVLHSDEPDYYHGYLWHTTVQGVGSYSGGQWFHRERTGANTWGTGLPSATYDAAFHTFVTVPEPSIIVLLGTAVLALLAYTWRRRRQLA